MGQSGARRRTMTVLATLVVLLGASLVVVGSPSLAGPSTFSTPGGGATPLPTGAGADASGAVMVAPAYEPLPDVSELAPLPGSVPLSIVVGLATTDPSGLAGLLSALYAPGSPQYREFWTPSELAREFGATPTSIATASGYFDRFGLSVEVSPDHLMLSVEGPSSELAAAFGTSFEEFRANDGSVFVSHLSPASLPAIAPWSGVYGLGNVTPISPSLTEAVRELSPIAPSATCSGSGPALLPCQLWQAYGTSGFIAGGVNGSGYDVAVVDAYSSDEPQSQLESDLSAFSTTTGIPVGTVHFDYPVPTSSNINVSTNPDWADEDALDVEWARAMAPGAAVSMIYSPNSGAGLYEAIDWAVAHQEVNVLSLSWGEPDVGIYNAYNTPCSSACNASTDGSYALLTPVLQFAAAEGISVFAASGDCGSADGTSGVATNYPASDPAVTGVGGTALNVDSSGNYLSETAWGGNATGASSPGCVNQGGSGGGYSPFPRPWWQDSVSLGPAHRGVPDVAADAATPGLVVIGGLGVEVGGTSLSTPIWAGVAAIADQNAGRPLGLLDPALYALSTGADYSRDFHDIQTGDNGYSAGVGWDPVTGLGSPNATTLVPDLASATTLPLSSLATFVYGTPRFGAAPLGVDFHVNASGGSGSYPLEGVSFGDGNASYASGGTATHTFVTPGVYSVQSYVGDSRGNFSVSPPIVVVVGGGHALNVSLTASTTTPSVDAPVGFVATVTGGVSPYLYNFTFGDGTFLLGSSASSVNHSFGVVGGFCVAVVVTDSAEPVDGGASSRVAVSAGGGAAPTCSSDTTPLTVTALPDVGVRDAPADFPALFSTAGGSTAAGTLAPSFQYRSSDPYVGACACAIFRSPGTYEVSGYANDSENLEAVGVTNVTVAAPLLANFTASPTFGASPLRVAFRVSATGGYGANASNTTWTLSNGTVLEGSSVSALFSLPGEYLIVGHLSDRGHGNASEAFLIDVTSDAASSTPAVTATVEPAVDVPLGTNVRLTAREFTSNGSASPATFLWSIANRSGAYRSDVNWTFTNPLPVSAGRSMAIDLTAFGLADGSVLRDSFALSDFEAVEASGFLPLADALTMSDVGGPTVGAAPVGWSGTASASGPGAVTIAWAVGGGPAGSGPNFQDVLGAGEYTVQVTAADSFGDSAVDLHSVTATGPLDLTGSLSSLSGVAPLTVSLHASASGGVGPPYRFLWLSSTGSNLSGPNGTITFDSPGSYELTLRANDSFGDQGQKVFDLQVDPAAAAFLPTVFVLVGAGVGAVAAAVAALSVRRPRRPSFPPAGATL